MDARSQIRAFALLGLVMAFWAGNSIVGRAVADDVPPFTLALVRWTGALALVLPFALRTLRHDGAALREAWRVVLALGLLGVAAFNALLYSGLHFTTASNALLLQAAIPALVMLLDRWVFKVRSGWLQIVATALSTLGVLVVIFRGDWTAALALDLNRGDALVLCAVVAWALYTILLRLRPQVRPISLIAVTFAIGVAAMAPLSAWEIARGARVEFGWPVALAFLYVALFPSVISYSIYNSAAQVVGPARAGQAITLMPLFGALLSAVLLGERLHPYHALGMALICFGIVLGAVTLMRGRGPGAG